MSGQHVVAVGASAGGVSALQELCASLDPDIPASFLVVLHIWPLAESDLPGILARSGPLPARHPRGGEEVAPGQIYVARPDHHLVMEGNLVRLNRGPVVNRHRPSIDVLFRSVAQHQDGRTVGILLTGSDDDGTAGMAEIRNRGGVTIVQDPEESMFSEMPASALRHGVVDHKLKLSEIGGCLRGLTTGEVADQKPPARDPQMEAGQREAERVYSCPDCGGGMAAVMDHGILQFRCRVGHVLSPHSMLAAENDSVERALWGAVRALEDSAAVLRRIAGQDAIVASARHQYIQRATEKEAHAQVIREVLKKD